MNILTTKQIREVDDYTIQNEPIPSIDLMERAALACTNWLIKNTVTKHGFAVFAGPGNNGGDGLAIARQLADRGISATMCLVKIGDRLSHDAEINLDRLKKQNLVPVNEVCEGDELSSIDEKVYIIDALFGSGLTRPLEGFPATIVHHLNSLENDIIAIDIPSGLFGEDNVKNTGTIINAKNTLTFQLPKLSFLFAEQYSYTGDWYVLSIGLDKDFIRSRETNYFFVSREDTRNILHKRRKFDHKGNYGHALLIAGSYGKMGAAVLASKACLRTGAGLFTANIPKCGYSVIQTAVPEAMTFIDPSEEMFSSAPETEGITAIGIGPGLGTNLITQQALKELITSFKKPMVLDADAINIISQNKEWLKELPSNTILTPHPGEFDRLAGKSTNGYERHLKQLKMSKEYSVYIVLKGAYTSTTTPEGKCYFNSTGNPGMATAGSGDVLTGIILSLLAQGYSSKEASLFGVYLHGLAGDIAVLEQSLESVIAGDIISNLGNAFNKINLD